MQCYDAALSAKETNCKITKNSRPLYRSYVRSTLQYRWHIGCDGEGDNGVGGDGEGDNGGGGNGSGGNVGVGNGRVGNGGGVIMVAELLLISNETE